MSIQLIDTVYKQGAKNPEHFKVYIRNLIKHILISKNSYEQKHFKIINRTVNIKSIAERHRGPECFIL